MPLTELADLRRAISDAAGRPMIVQRHADADVRRFVARRRPRVARDTRPADAGSRHPHEADAARRPRRRGRSRASTRTTSRGTRASGLTMLDPAPRVVLDPELGMLTAGASVRDAQIAADIYHHTIPVLEAAEDRARRLRRAPARAGCSTSSTGSSSRRSSARPARRPPLAGHGRARHRGGFGDRTRVAPRRWRRRARRSRASISGPNRDDRPVARRGRHRRRRGRRARYARPSRRSAASTSPCSPRASSARAKPIADLRRRELARDDGRQRRRERAAAPRAPSAARALAGRRPRRRRSARRTSPRPAAAPPPTRRRRRR